MLSQTEENYLKAIFKTEERTAGAAANTNAIAAALETTPASVTDMLKRLSEKRLIHYEKYKGVTLTTQGGECAKMLVRKHRLWEVFLVEKLHYRWDQVHDLAEQLEHIQSEDLIDRLDYFLGTPRFDPHGDPIPDAKGIFIQREQILLSELENHQEGIVVGVYEHAPAFLKQLDALKIALGTTIKIIDRYEFDHSLKIVINTKETALISQKVSKSIFVTATSVAASPYHQSKISK